MSLANRGEGSHEEVERRINEEDFLEYEYDYDGDFDIRTGRRYLRHPYDRLETARLAALRNRGVDDAHTTASENTGYVRPHQVLAGERQHSKRHQTIQLVFLICKIFLQLTEARGQIGVMTLFQNPTF